MKARYKIHHRSLDAKLGQCFTVSPAVSLQLLIMIINVLCASRHYSLQTGWFSFIPA